MHVYSGLWFKKIPPHSPPLLHLYSLNLDTANCNGAPLVWVEIEIEWTITQTLLNRNWTGQPYNGNHTWNGRHKKAGNTWLPTTCRCILRSLPEGVTIQYNRAHTRPKAVVCSEMVQPHHDFLPNPPPQTSYISISCGFSSSWLIRSYSTAQQCCQQQSIPRCRIYRTPAPNRGRYHRKSSALVGARDCMKMGLQVKRSY